MNYQDKHDQFYHCMDTLIQWFQARDVEVHSPRSDPFIWVTRNIKSGGGAVRVNLEELAEDLIGCEDFIERDPIEEQVREFREQERKGRLQTIELQRLHREYKRQQLMKNGHRM